jgi:hypothetical protein
VSRVNLKWHNMNKGTPIAHRARILLTACCLVTTAFPIMYTPAQASGYIQMPEQTQMFPSFNSCLKAMEDAYRVDQAQVKPETTTVDGAIRSVTFESATSGIKWLSRRKTHYVGRVWFHNGRLRPELDQIEANHSWQQTDLMCNGRVMTRKPASGFTLSTFDPIPIAEPK